MFTRFKYTEDAVCGAVAGLRDLTDLQECANTAISRVNDGVLSTCFEGAYGRHVMRCPSNDNRLSDVRVKTVIFHRYVPSEQNTNALGCERRFDSHPPAFDIPTSGDQATARAAAHQQLTQIRPYSESESS